MNRRLSTEDRSDKPLTKRESMDALICKQCGQQFVPHYDKQTVCDTCAIKNLRRFWSGEYSDRTPLDAAARTGGSQRPVNSSPTILLECPACKRSVQVEREPHTPPLAVRMTNWCECTQGFDDERYFDKDGNELAVWGDE